MNLKPKKAKLEDWEVKRKPSTYLWWLIGILSIVLVFLIVFVFITWPDFSPGKIKLCMDKGLDGSVLCDAVYVEYDSKFVTSVTAWNKEIKAASFCSLCTHLWDECMIENTTKERFNKECNCTRYHAEEVVANQEQLDAMHGYLSNCIYSVNVTIGFDDTLFISLGNNDIITPAEYMLNGYESKVIRDMTHSFAVYDYGKNEYGPYFSDHMEVKGNTKADCIVQSDYMICDQINATRMRCAPETTHKCNESRIRIDFFGADISRNVDDVMRLKEHCDEVYKELTRGYNLTVPMDLFEFYRAVYTKDFAIRKNITTDRCEEVKENDKI